MNCRLNEPLVSVILCVFNGAKFVDSAIESIIKQTYQNWELIVINDGSNDSTSEVLKKYKQSKIRIFHQKNVGLTKSLNIGVSYAKGDLIARQDADDYSLPDRFKKQVEIFNNNEKIVLVGTGTIVMDDSENELYRLLSPKTKAKAIKSCFEFKNPFVHGSLMIKKSAFNQINGYDESFKFSQDFDLIIRLSLVGEFDSTSENLYVFKLHQNSITVNKGIKQVTTYIKITRTIYVHYQIVPLLGLLELIPRTTKIIFYSLYPTSVKHNYLIASTKLKNREYKTAIELFNMTLKESKLFFPSLIKLLLANYIKCKEEKITANKEEPC